MKFVRSLLLFLVILLVVIGIAGFFLPTAVHVERSITINAPAERVYTLVSDFKEWEKWSPWFGLDPDAKYTYEGSDVGSRSTWTSEDPSVGSGTQTITAMQAPSSVTTALDFGADGVASARFDLAATGAGTDVIWSFDTDFSDSYVGRYFGLFLDKMVGGQFMAGLEKLKRVAEGG